MPTKKTWLLRLPEIRQELAAMKVPVVDRAVFERLFGVRRRRAIQLLHYFHGFQSGRTFLIDRISLLEQLAPLQDCAEFAVEQRRRQRLVESLDALRRARAGTRVMIPVVADTGGHGVRLPPGVHVEPGSLRICFDDIRDLLSKLYSVSQVAAADFERFRAAIEEPEPACQAVPGGDPGG